MPGPAQVERSIDGIASKTRNELSGSQPVLHSPGILWQCNTQGMVDLIVASRVVWCRGVAAGLDGDTGRRRGEHEEWGVAPWADTGEV